MREYLSLDVRKQIHHAPPRASRYEANVWEDMLYAFIREPNIDLAYPAAHFYTAQDKTLEGRSKK
jgi:hypothetical protein